MEHYDLSIFVGRIIKKILHLKREYGSDELLFVFDNNDVICFNHVQDCCESVYIESITGDLLDLLNSPLTICRSVSSDKSNLDVFNSFLIENDIKSGDLINEDADSSETWTFYTFATINGYVDVRWYGTSNGYYSESVSCQSINNLSEYLEENDKKSAQVIEYT
jgi:hypothetical protein